MMKVGKAKKVTIPPSVVKEIEKIPAYFSRTWEPWQDEVLKKYWPIKRREELAGIIGKCRDACMNRYKKLMGKNGK
jgi:hypothetical protein